MDYYIDVQWLRQISLIRVDDELTHYEGRKCWLGDPFRFKKLVQQASEASCVFITNEFLVKTHDDRHYTKCYLDRKVRRFRMDAHEHPLPADPIHAKTVVFELSCPNAFTAYRDCSWQIISSLAFPTAQVSALEPRVILGDYSELKPYIQLRYANISFIEYE